MARWEILMLDNQQVGRPKVHRPLTAMARVTGGEIVRGYHGAGDILALWGYGGLDQRHAFKKHRESGRNVVCIDLGYWAKGEGSVRFALNAWHPEERDIEQAGEPRPGYKVPDLDDSFYNSTGHIVLCGVGKKSRKLLGYDGMQWEEGQLKILREIYPGRRIIYRPKPNQEEALQGAENGSSGTIFDHLRGAALAICLHSNVSIDCAIAGIPCVSYAGIGSYGYRGSTIQAPFRLTGSARGDFLNRVAWFNWKHTEFAEMVIFIERLIEGRK